MLTNIFPSQVYIGQCSDNLDNVIPYLQSLHLQRKVQYGDYIIASETELFLFSPEHLQACPDLQYIINAFVNAFDEIDIPSYNVRSALLENKALVKLSFMGKGEHKDIHIHTGAAGWGVFYLNNINHGTNGGNLRLYHPGRFNDLLLNNTNPGILPSYPVSIKRGKVIAAPNYIWHGVDKYNGEEDRMAIVVTILSDYDS